MVLGRRELDWWKKKEVCQDWVPRLGGPPRYNYYSCCSVLNYLPKYSENTTKWRETIKVFLSP